MKQFIEQTAIKQSEKVLNKPRNIFIVFLLSLLIPSVGQIYNGQLKKAVLFISLMLLLPVMFGVTKWVTSFYGFLICALISLVLWIYIIVDGVINAKRQKEYVLKPFNTWYFYILVAIGIFAIGLIFESCNVLRVKSYNITAGSSMPTLQIEDRVVADMTAYNKKKPNYGDLVIYATDDEGKMYIHRVIGLPNDKIELVDGMVSINGKVSKTTLVNEAVHNGWNEYKEELPNGHKHLMYGKINKLFAIGRENKKTAVVPLGHYYILGDNRNDAQDSRYRGFISRDYIKGRILYSIYGATKDRVNVDFRSK